MDLEKRERSHGLSYVAFSRAKRLSQIGILGALPLDRLTMKISNQSRMTSRLQEELRLTTLDPGCDHKYLAYLKDLMKRRNFAASKHKQKESNGQLNRQLKRQKLVGQFNGKRERELNHITSDALQSNIGISKFRGGS